MIYFRTIRWKNLLSTGNVFTEIDLCGKDTTLIVGQNGAGKSTILDALSFVLFGKPFRKINKPQLMNTITQKNLVVEIEFSVGTTNYKIIRGMKPNVFEVYQNDKLLNQSAEMKDYQEILEKQILKVNHRSFCQVVILGSATFQPFMQLPGGQRREVIEDLLDLHIFTTMNSLLKDKILHNNESILETVSKKKLFESKIEMTKEHLAELEANTDKLIEEKSEIIIKTKKKIDQNEVDYNNIIDKSDKLLEQIKNDEIISKKINKLSELRHKIEARRAILNADVEFFNSHQSCPTCKQQIEEEFRKTSINEKQNQIEAIENGLAKLYSEYDEMQKKMDEILKINKDIQKLELSKIELRTNISSLTKYCKQLEQEIEKLNQNKTVGSDNKLSEYQKELVKIQKNYNSLTEEKNLLSVAGTLLKDTGIKAKIIKQYIPIINKLINKYLSSMDFFVSFELDENFNETIKSRYRDAFTYSSFSEGEKQKIDLALLFTWRAIAKLRNSINTNLLIMDEVFDSSLDGNATDYLMNILRDVSKDSNIIIISHKDHMNEKFNNVIRFKKTKNFSAVE